MSNTTISLERRAQVVSIFGFLIQLSLFGTALWVGLWFGSDAVLALSRHLLGGVLIWVALFLVYTQRRQSRIEDLETESLKQTQKAGLATNIFDVENETQLLARRRLSWTYKFVLPFVTIILAVYHVLGTFVFWRWPLGEAVDSDIWQRSGDHFPPLLFAGAVAFVSSVYARYVIGMSRQPHWQLLRAGGSYLIGNALSATLLIVAFAVSGSEAASVWAEPVAAYAVRGMMFLLGAELVANFILEFYRPRHSGEEVRPAFDSRLLGLFGEPGGVVRSIAETANYQFGFEVSGTWVYRLIQRSVFPLTAMTACVLVLLSGIVVIDVDEEAYTERFGRLVQAESTPLSPGLHLKWPWPIDQTVRTRVDTLRTLTIGDLHEAEHEDEGDEDDHGHHDDGINTASHPILWTEEHAFNKEMLTVVASPYGDSVTLEQGGGTDSDAPRRSRSVSVSLLMISVQIEYEIKNIYDFEYRYLDPERVLESIAYQELADYAAGVDATSLMGVGRIDFGPQMQTVLQKRFDDLQLGVRLTNVMLQDVHPPSQSEVARTFQGVVAAEIQKSATIEGARGAARRLLTLAAGSSARAEALDHAIQEVDRLNMEARGADPSEAASESLAAAELLKVAEARVQDLMFGNKSLGMQPASGQVSFVIAAAQADRSARIRAAETKLLQYGADTVAFEASGELFKARRYLAVLGDILGRVRKVVVTGDPSNVIVEWNSQGKASLDLTAPGLPGAEEH